MEEDADAATREAASGATDATKHIYGESIPAEAADANRTEGDTNESPR